MRILLSLIETLSVFVVVSGLGVECVPDQLTRVTVRMPAEGVAA